MGIPGAHAPQTLLDSRSESMYVRLFVVSGIYQFQYEVGVTPHLSLAYALLCFIGMLIVKYLYTITALVLNNYIKHFVE
jgi:hypothetical protein